VVADGQGGRGSGDAHLCWGGGGVMSGVLHGRKGCESSGAARERAVLGHGRSDGAAGRHFMAQACTGQCCRGSQCQVEMEL
jgi:hypothetical protein